MLPKNFARRSGGPSPTVFPSPSRFSTNLEPFYLINIDKGTLSITLPPSKEHLHSPRRSAAILEILEELGLFQKAVMRALIVKTSKVVYDRQVRTGRRVDWVNPLNGQKVGFVVGGRSVVLKKIQPEKEVEVIDLEEEEEKERKVFVRRVTPKKVIVRSQKSLNCLYRVENTKNKKTSPHPWFGEKFIVVEEPPHHPPSLPLPKQRISIKDSLKPEKIPEEPQKMTKSTPKPSIEYIESSSESTPSDSSSEEEEEPPPPPPKKKPPPRYFHNHTPTTPIRKSSETGRVYFSLNSKLSPVDYYQNEDLFVNWEKFVRTESEMSKHYKTMLVRGSIPSLIIYMISEGAGGVFVEKSLELKADGTVQIMIKSEDVTEVFLSYTSLETNTHLNNVLTNLKTCHLCPGQPHPLDHPLSLNCRIYNDRMYSNNCTKVVFEREPNTNCCRHCSVIEVHYNKTLNKKKKKINYGSYKSLSGENKSDVSVRSALSELFQEFWKELGLNEGSYPDTKVDLSVGVVREQDLISLPESVPVLEDIEFEEEGKTNLIFSKEMLQVEGGGGVCWADPYNISNTNIFEEPHLNEDLLATNISQSMYTLYEDDLFPSFNGLQP